MCANSSVRTYSVQMRDRIHAKFELLRVRPGARMYIGTHECARTPILESSWHAGLHGKLDSRVPRSHVTSHVTRDRLHHLLVIITKTYRHEDLTMMLGKTMGGVDLCRFYFYLNCLPGKRKSGEPKLGGALPLGIVTP